MILFTMPGTTYFIKHDRDAFEIFVDDYVLDSINNATHELTKEKHAFRKEKRVLLVFPNHVELSMKEIEDYEGEDETTELFPTSITNIYTHKKFPGVDNAKHFVLWKVSRLDVKSYKKGRVQGKTKGRLRDGFLNAAHLLGGGGRGGGGNGGNGNGGGVLPDETMSG